ncbi:hypothetical protein NDN08_005901 [Rhodosorus marinus]|uniref:VWFD domain-containing protein n=1 Tax=Rhodosorus marinus TaxID=101924 RepID=A0AAV8V395_9RHOD|nr:hypothetical protein NDN08_005901 [Rhodosorus marinus]
MRAKIFGAALVALCSFAVAVVEMDPVEVLMSDGAADIDVNMMVPACGDLSVKVKSSDSMVLDADDAVITMTAGSACMTNMTMSAVAHSMPGMTKMTVDVSEGGKAVETYVVPIVAKGIVVYSEDDDTVDIVSGSGQMFTPGTYKDVIDYQKKNGEYTFDVAYYNGEDGSADWCAFASIDNVFVFNEDDLDYINNAPGCPAQAPADGKMDEDCQVYFSNDCSKFVMKLNDYRVGCGAFELAIHDPNMSVDGGDPFFTAVMITYTDADKVPVVVMCNSVEVDAFGLDYVSMDTMNLWRCEGDVEGFDGSFDFGPSNGAWETVNGRVGKVYQTVSMKTSSSLATGGDGTVSMTGGQLSLSTADGTIEVDVVSETESCVKAEYGPAVEAPVASAEGFSQEVIISGVFPSIIGVTKANNIVNAVKAALNIDDVAYTGVVEEMSGSSRLAEECTDMMCTLRNVASRLTMNSATRQYGSRVAITVSCNGAGEIATLKDDSDFIEATKVLEGSVVYAGAAGGAAVGGAASLSTGIIAVIVVGILGLIVLILAIVYVVVTDRDEATTDSEWTEGGVSVEGVPVPSSRFFDAVVVDGYGRGEVAPDEARAEAPTSAVPNS